MDKKFNYFHETGIFLYTYYEPQYQPTTTKTVNVYINLDKVVAIEESSLTDTDENIPDRLNLTIICDGGTIKHIEDCQKDFVEAFLEAWHRWLRKI